MGFCFNLVVDLLNDLIRLIRNDDRRIPSYSLPMNFWTIGTKRFGNLPCLISQQLVRKILLCREVSASHAVHADANDLHFVIFK